MCPYSGGRSLPAGEVYPAVHDWMAMTDFLTEINQGPLVVPHRAEDTGIRRGALQELALKKPYLHGEVKVMDLNNPLFFSLGGGGGNFHFFLQKQLFEVKGKNSGSNPISASQ